MKTTVQCWFEFASTYSYIAVLTAEQVVKDAGHTLEWKPFLLGPLFTNVGWNDSPFNIYAAKGHYMWRDMERLCAGAGLPFRRPSQFPRNGILAARIAIRYSHKPWMMEFVRSAFAANFVEDQDIGDRGVIASLLHQVHQDPDMVIAGAEEPQNKLLLRQQTEEAATRGIFGAPTFTVGREIFWGNDRLPQAIEWARRVS